MTDGEYPERNHAMTNFSGNYQSLRDQGWHAIPVSAEKIALVPGFHGAGGAFPTLEDQAAWAADFTNAEPAIRLPATVVGIDVDHYDKVRTDGTIVEKRGLDEIADTEKAWGSLPPTYTLTARPATGSGIRLFRVPVEGLSYRDLSSSVETIHVGNRYAMAPGSYHPGVKAKVLVLDPEGMPCGMPRPEDLPLLPEAWIKGLSQGELDPNYVRKNITDTQAKEWIAQRKSGPACDMLLNFTSKALADFDNSGHQNALNAVYAVINFMVEGHSGGANQLDRIKEGFEKEVSGRRSEQTMNREWRGLVRGAVARVWDVTTQDDGKCLCEVDFKPARADVLPTFPVEVLPEVIRDHVRNTAYTHRQKPDLAALMALSTVGAATCGRLEVEVTPSYNLPCNLWTISFMAAGEAKTPITNKVCDPFKRAVDALKIDKMDDVSAYRADIKEAKAHLAAAEKDAKNSNDWTQVTEAEKALGRLESNPVNTPKLVVDDATPEAMFLEMERQAGRLAYMTGEGRNFTTMVGIQYGKAPNLTALLKSYDGDEVHYDRVGRANVAIPSARFSVGMAVQLDMINLFTSSEVRMSGLPERALFALPAASNAPLKRGFNEVKDTRANLRWKSFIQAATLAFYDRELDDPVMLRFTAEAMSALEDYKFELDSEVDSLRGDGDVFASYLNKDVAKVVRVSGLLHLARTGPREVVKGNARQIGLEDVQAAILICRYAMAHFKRIFNLDEHDRVDDDTVRVLKSIHSYLTADSRKDKFAGLDEVPIAKSEIRTNGRHWRSWEFERLSAALYRAEEIRLIRIEAIHEKKLVFVARPDAIEKFLNGLSD